MIEKTIIFKGWKRTWIEGLPVGSVIETRRPVQGYQVGDILAVRVNRFKPETRARLEVLGVRQEPVQAITEAGALAEGMPAYSMLAPVDAFRECWQAIYGPDSWEVNPMVWVYELRKI